MLASNQVFERRLGSDHNVIFEYLKSKQIWPLLKFRQLIFQDSIYKKGKIKISNFFLNQI